MWNQNCEALLELLDVNDVNQKIMIAEIYRNKGEFDKCMDLINSIESSEFDGLKEAFNKECESKNMKVFQF